MNTIANADLAGAMTEAMNELSDLFAACGKRNQPDPRAWQQLLIYAPSDIVIARADLLKARTPSDL